jgi:CBS-domain-containing membrane protein
VKGRLLTGEKAVICTLVEGGCPLQVMRSLTGGRHVAVCLQPQEALSDWRQATESSPDGMVSRYMTTAVVTAGPQAPLSELARMMVDARIHRILVLDDGGRPVGVVSSTDIMAAMARDGLHDQDLSPQGELR